MFLRGRGNIFIVHVKEQGSYIELFDFWVKVDGMPLSKI